MKIIFVICIISSEGSWRNSSGWRGDYSRYSHTAAAAGVWAVSVATVIHVVIYHTRADRYTIIITIIRSFIIIIIIIAIVVGNFICGPGGHLGGPYRSHWWRVDGSIR